MESLTFMDPDEDVGNDDLFIGDSQGDDFKFAFTLPSQMTQQSQADHRKLNKTVNKFKVTKEMSKHFPCMAVLVKPVYVYQITIIFNYIFNISGLEY